MEFFRVTTNYLSLTNDALDLINFFSQLLTVSFGILFGLLTLIILILIFKS